MNYDRISIAAAAELAKLSVDMQRKSLRPAQVLGLALEGRVIVIAAAALRGLGNSPRL